MRPLPEGFVPLFPSRPSLCVCFPSARMEEAGRRDEIGGGGPLELSPSSNSYLHDVNRCNPITVFYSLFFFLSLIQADISRQGLRGVADARLWLAYMCPLNDTYCRASSRHQCLLNTLLIPLYGVFRASHYRFKYSLFLNYYICWTAVFRLIFSCRIKMHQPLC